MHDEQDAKKERERFDFQEDQLQHTPCCMFMIFIVTGNIVIFVYCVFFYLTYLILLIKEEVAWLFFIMISMSAMSVITVLSSYGWL